MIKSSFLQRTHFLLSMSGASLSLALSDPAIAEPKLFCNQVSDALANYTPPQDELVNIGQVVEEFSKAARINLIQDRNVNGKIKLHFPKEANTSKETCEAFLSALEVLNLTVVEGPNSYSVRPIRTALKAVLPLYENPKNIPVTHQYVSTIYHPNFANASELKKALSKQVHSNYLIAQENSNLLFMRGSGTKVREMMNYINKMDTENWKASKPTKNTNQSNNSMPLGNSPRKE